jgi:foldase protein PrsA
VLTVVGYAVGRGIGPPSIPSGDVALVEDAPNGDITKEEYQSTLKRVKTAAASQGQAVSPDQLSSAAISQLIQQRWFEGEAADRGITVADSQVNDEFNSRVQQAGLKSEKQIQAALKQAGVTEAEAKDQIRLQLLTQRLQKAVIPSKPPEISDAEVKNFYEANIYRYQQPETRDFYVILNKDPAKVQAAADALAKDDSPSNWAKVAKQYSTDPTSKATGGLRKGVAKGQSEPKLEDQVFSAPTGQLVGPFQGENGYYLIEVKSITPAKTAPLDKQITPQIQQEMQGNAQQAVALAFQTELSDKWIPRTFCTSEVSNAQCENYTAPVTTCTPQAAKQKQCPTPVVFIKPFVSQPFPSVAGSTPPVTTWNAKYAAPGTAGLPQGPQFPAPPPPQTTGLPGSVIPSGTIPSGSTGSGG